MHFYECMLDLAMVGFKFWQKNGLKSTLLLLYSAWPTVTGCAVPSIFICEVQFSFCSYDKVLTL